MVRADMDVDVQPVDLGYAWGNPSMLKIESHSSQLGLV